MRNIWLISDTHFGHENIIKYCNRPFKNAAEMDEFMLTAWNETVQDGDIVYHLGDVYFRNHQILYGLKGRKRLLLGNHDNGRCQHLQACFQKMGVWRMFPEFGILLSHVPVHEDTLDINKCPVNIHGHIHDRHIMDRGIRDHRYLNISVEQTGYKPIHIDEVRQRAGLSNFTPA